MGNIRLNTSECNVTPFPGRTAARNAITDPKTPAWIREIAQGMTGDTAPEDLIWIARGKSERHLSAEEIAAITPQVARPELDVGTVYPGIIAYGGAAAIFMAGVYVGILATAARMWGWW